MGSLCQPLVGHRSHNTSSRHQTSSTRLLFIRNKEEMSEAVVEMSPAPAAAPAPAPAGNKGEYPTGLSATDEELMGELTLDELKMAFRLFDDQAEGYIRVLTFRKILKEIDEDFSDDELDGIINDIDIDGSGTIDFDEFCKIMT